MATSFKTACYFVLINIATAYYHQYPELSPLMPKSDIPQGYEEYLEQVQNNPGFINKDGTGNLFKTIGKLREEIMSVRIEDGIPEEYKGNFTYECQRDLDRYARMLSNPIYNPLWASRMFDATGFWESGVLDGNFLFEGRYEECKRAVEPETSPAEYPITGLYCITYWYEHYPELGWMKRGHGICIPDTCTDEDAIFYIRNVILPSLPLYISVEVHCERGKPDMSNDPEAIITLVIMSLFCILVLLATIYHYFVVETNSETAVVTAPTESTKDMELVTWGNKGRKETISAENETDQPVLNSATQINGAVNQQNRKVQDVGVVSTTIFVMPNGNMGTTSVIQTQFENPEQNLQPINSEANGHLNNGYMQDSDKETDTSTAPKFNEAAIIAKAECNHECRDKKPMSSLNMAEQFLLSFSMYVTFPLVTTTKQHKGAYGCLNGLRFLAMAAVILGHTYVLGTVDYPQTVENEFVMYSRWLKPAYYKIITMDVYVDTFFILSAFLVTISFLRKLQKTNGHLGVTGWIMHYFGRYWRLTPTYFIVLMIYTNLWHYFGTGPFMKQYVLDADSCEASWWTNLLYINNIYIDAGWCFGWSWYLCVDWQLFCIAPLFLYTLWRWKWLGIGLNIAGFCAGLCATVVLKYKLYTQPADAEDPVDDFVDIYIKPWCRCPVYFMGILLGYYFYRTEGKIKMPWWLVAVGWFVAVAMYGLVSYLPALTTCTSSDICGPWTPEGKTAYYSLNRIMWGIWVCWVILACSTGYGGFFNTFLSWKFFVPLGKLTYLGYLIHPIFTYLYFFRSPVQQYYYDYFFVYLFAANLLIVHFWALIMATVVSAPLMGSIAVFLPSMRSKDRR